MSLASILTAIPWGRLLSALPPIVHTARELLLATHKNETARKHELEGANLPNRLARLEENERIQSELVQKMTEQLQGTTESLRILSARITVLFWFGFIALFLSLTSLILVLRK